MGYARTFGLGLLCLLGMNVGITFIWLLFYGLQTGDIIGPFQNFFSNLQNIPYGLLGFITGIFGGYIYPDDFIYSGILYYKLYYGVFLNFAALQIFLGIGLVIGIILTCVGAYFFARFAESRKEAILAFIPANLIVVFLGYAGQFMITLGTFSINLFIGFLIPLLFFAINLSFYVPIVYYLTKES